MFPNLKKTTLTLSSSDFVKTLTKLEFDDSPSPIHVSLYGTSVLKRMDGIWDAGSGYGPEVSEIFRRRIQVVFCLDDNDGHPLTPNQCQDERGIFFYLFLFALLTILYN
jgi:hypothetical protein